MNIIPSTKRAALKMTGVMSCIIQNGPMEGPVHYGSGNASPQVAMSSSKDSHNGNVGANDTPRHDTPKRPKILGVSSSSAYVPKTVEDVDGGGSQACTPDPDGKLDGPGSAQEAAVLEHDTRQLIGRFLGDFTGYSKPQWTESRELATMKRVVQGVLEKHRFAYNGMLSKLSLDNRSDDTSFVRAVAKSLFADGTTNWGRIASLVAFGAVVCQYLKENGRGNCVELVGQEISTYLLSDQRDWLVKNNTWDGFVEFFRVADPESTVRNTLMAVAGFAGLGATLALLIR